MRRDDFPLKTAHIVTFIKEDSSEWATNYLADWKEESLRRQIRRLIPRHGFSFRRSSRTVLSTVELEQEQAGDARTTGAAIRAAYSCDCTFNTDETVVYFADEPVTIIAEKGSKKIAKVRGRSRISRASVLLTVSAAGRELPPLIIFRGVRGAPVAEECKHDNSGVRATVQKNAWMDATVWNDEFVDWIWANYISVEHPSGLALYVDNLKCHVSAESRDHLSEWGTEMVPLPKNTTSVLQPLDVGIMGPFKKKMYTLSLDYEIQLLALNRSASLRDRLKLLKNTPAQKQRGVLVVRVTKAWSLISDNCVLRAWEKAGL
ncbi:hypothetical protein PC116_g19982 [Phytophthora cactorum]|uniref:DDE-1 domain-containing protein n=1 Tax=Phytophthora cactorum TaxID=29920 RepID=A0A329SBN7_9STRA|nr:hypothetical protein Pcac1_g17187 [Phytophthora cactorum]KAG4231768.1 hypothetical protein PC116_g19982 [Phytophthora cactorum]RAW34297.1 hypothetical protein PC110_g9365 [Phytophthora cactorum]